VVQRVELASSKQEGLRSGHTEDLKYGYLPAAQLYSPRKECKRTL